MPIRDNKRITCWLYTIGVDAGKATIMANLKAVSYTHLDVYKRQTTATPKAYAGSVPVFCAHDAIVPLKDLRPNPKNPNQHPPEQIKLCLLYTSRCV